MTEKNTTKKTSARGPQSSQKRSLARLAAVQALYDIDLTGTGVDAVLADFLEYGLGRKVLITPSDEYEPEVEESLAPPDGVLLASIVRGVIAERERLDLMIGGALTNDWTVERLEAVLRAILRAGAFELTTRPDVPIKVVISEYVDIAHAFYAGHESKLVNAVLDRIARVARDGESVGNNVAGG